MNSTARLPTLMAALLLPTCLVTALVSVETTSPLRHPPAPGFADLLTALAAWLLVIVSTGMIVANVLPAVQLVVLGLLLIVSIVATNFIYSRAQR